MRPADGPRWRGLSIGLLRWNVQHAVTYQLYVHYASTLYYPYFGEKTEILFLNRRRRACILMNVRAEQTRTACPQAPPHYENCCGRTFRGTRCEAGGNASGPYSSQSSSSSSSSSRAPFPASSATGFVRPRYLIRFFSLKTRTFETEKNTTCFVRDDELDNNLKYMTRTTTTHILTTDYYKY